MFGVVRPCRHGMCASLFKEWTAHLCGLCLTLRSEYGQSARLVTNYDGLLISVLVEAQRPERSPHRTAGPCVLRGMRGADVVDHRAEGARLAAAVSLLLAAGKTRDHLADGDGVYGRGPVGAPARWAAGRMAGRWDAVGARTGTELGLDTAVLRTAAERQAELEIAALRSLGGAPAGPGLLDLTEPTETAVAAAFAHTAVLAGTPGNADGLAEAGRFFGRLAHLLDAVEDLGADRAAGAFNPLLATGTGLEEARRHCDDALHGLRLALADTVLADRRLAEALLVRELERSVTRTFDGGKPPAGNGDTAAGNGDAPEGSSKIPVRRAARPGPALLCPAWTMVACTCGLWQPPWSEHHGESCGDRCWCGRNCDCDCDCCDCCSDGCDCCDCDCCDCDCG